MNKLNEGYKLLSYKNNLLKFNCKNHYCDSKNYKLKQSKVTYHIYLKVEHDTQQ